MPSNTSWSTGGGLKWQSYDPWVTQGAQSTFGSAQDWLSKNPWQDYSGPMSAAFGPQFGQASNFLSGELGQTNPYTAQAGGAYGSIAGAINPNASISDYMSQYVGQALQPALDNINLAAQQQGQRNNANATLQGSYGGTASGVLQGLLDRATQQNIAGATGNAYNQAFQQAASNRLGELGALSGAASGLLGTGQSAFGQGTTLSSLLAGLGSQQQQAGQTGIQNAINLNTTNQTLPLQRQSTLASILAMVPKNTSGGNWQWSYGAQPAQNNTGSGILGSVLSSLFP